MLERILVPLDGSARAEHALVTAAHLARAFKSSIILLTVITPPVSSGKFSPPHAYPEGGIQEELAEATSSLKKLATSELLKGIPTQVQTPIGIAASAIIAAIEEVRADLVVLCSHGYTGLQHWMLGSVAEKVIRHAPVPVLIVRDGGPDLVPAAQQPIRLLVALDGSLLSEAILAPAAALTAGLAQAASVQGALQLVRVVDIPSSYGKFRSPVDSAYDALLKAEARRQDEEYLESIRTRFAHGELGPSSLTVTTCVQTDVDVARALVQTAEHGQVQGIAMATHGRSGVQYWALGSITERVLHASTLPLFILKPQPLAMAKHQQMEHKEEREL